MLTEHFVYSWLTVVLFAGWWGIHTALCRQLVQIELEPYDYLLRIDYFDAICRRQFFRAVKLLFIRRMRIVVQRWILYAIWPLAFYYFFQSNVGIFIFLLCVIYCFWLSTFYWGCVLFMDWRTRTRKDIQEVKDFLAQHFPQVDIGDR